MPEPEASGNISLYAPTQVIIQSFSITLLDLGRGPKYQQEKSKHVISINVPIKFVLFPITVVFVPIKLVFVPIKLVLSQLAASIENTLCLEGYFATASFQYLIHLIHF